MFTSVEDGCYYKQRHHNVIAKLVADKYTGMAYLVDTMLAREITGGTLQDIRGYLGRHDFYQLPLTSKVTSINEDGIRYCGKYHGKPYVLFVHTPQMVDDGIATLVVSGYIREISTIPDGSHYMIRAMDAAEVAYAYGLITDTKILSTIETDSREVRGRDKIGADILVKAYLHYGFNEATD